MITLPGCSEKLPAADPSMKDSILEDYEEAYRFWSWFHGMPSIDEKDQIEVDDCWYGRLDQPGINSIADLKELLQTRFTDELIDKEFNFEYFKEIDGKLYIAEFARGSDISIDHVDYEAYYDPGKKEGKVRAFIYRRDFDEKTSETYLTGKVDKVDIPFTMRESGAVFSSFSTIW
jgi:hypothetical protein